MRGRRYPSWSLEDIKRGIDKYHTENLTFPTSRDFDLYPDLPSARHIQRAFGGLEKLRKDLGYFEVNYNKGPLRTTISNTINRLGINAEENLERVLINKFGEPYVHTQKKYYKFLKNRYDFFIYCRDARFGVDVFTTGRSDYINVNVRHKLNKYKDVSKDIDIYFVVTNPSFTKENIHHAISGIKTLDTMTNIKVMREIDFIDVLHDYKALELPEGFRAVYT